MEPIGFKMKWVFCLMGLLLAFWTVLSFGIFSFPCSRLSWAFSMFIIISCSCFKLHCFACGISSFYVHGWPFLLALCFCSPTRYQPSLSIDSSPLFLPPPFFFFIPSFFFYMSQSSSLFRTKNSWLPIPFSPLKTTHLRGGKKNE